MVKFARRLPPDDDQTKAHLAAIFDALPDTAHVSIYDFAVLLDVLIADMWGIAQSDPDFPVPLKVRKRGTHFNVGQARRYLAKARLGLTKSDSRSSTAGEADLEPEGA